MEQYVCYRAFCSSYSAFVYFVSFDCWLFRCITENASSFKLNISKSIFILNQSRCVGLGLPHINKRGISVFVLWWRYIHCTVFKIQGFIRHLLNYTEYNQQWNVVSGNVKETVPSKAISAV